MDICHSNRSLVVVLTFLTLGLAIGIGVAHAQTVIHYNASDLMAHSAITVTPPSGTFQENTTFDVPIFLDTRNTSVNAIELHVKFDPTKLSVVRPSGGKSIIGIWVEPPTYDNTKGTVKIVGTIPGGITSKSGLIVTITFKAVSSGQTSVQINDATQVLLNDGLGTPTILQTTRGDYTIVPQPPGGVTVYSDTHPIQDEWYNNSNPVLSWSKDPGITGFSFLLDREPNTVPPNTISSASTSIAFESVNDGISYFHIKALKKGVWGSATQYMLHIDTARPADFTPHIDYVYASAINRFLVSYFTTDALSGIDHYEVGVIDKTKATTESPVFVESESPFQLPLNVANNARVIVRALDRAGNSKDGYIDVTVPFLPWKYLTDHLVQLLLLVLAIIFLLFIIHYLFGHHIVRRIRRIRELLRRDDSRAEAITSTDIKRRSR